MRNVRPFRRSSGTIAPDSRNILRLLVLAAIAAVCLALPARAQDADVPRGAGIVTMFSGWTDGGAPGEPVIDTDGESLKIYDLSNPGVPASGARWDDVPVILAVQAVRIGQVFGIALDNQEPANIYVTATSAYGLLRTPDGIDWANGMWGEGGGPGTVYKLDARNGYEPEIFANVTLDGRENSGAALGNIAFDPVNNQLFVSDLETGMIHAIDAETGEVFDRYDHGVEGRSYFLDTATADYAVQDVIEFDPESSADMTSCGDGPAGEAARRFAANPACWNLADFRRRVYGLAVETNPETGTARLYYAVWGAATFGNPDAGEAAEDAVNSIWSIGLDETGAFDLQTIRRELIMPEFFVSLQDTERFGASHPVTDIAFSGSGVMFVAERGGIAGLAMPGDLTPAAPAGSRVMAFARDENANWVPQGRYDVGYYERSDLDPPYLRANAAGGIALGYGYTEDGTLDTEAEDATLWMTGDDLCSESVPCPEEDARPTTGLQGAPVGASVDPAPPAAYTPYPDSGPVTEPLGPDASYMVPVEQDGEDLAPGQVGDVEIMRGGGAAPAADIDLAVHKAAAGACAPGQACYFDIEVQNVGVSPYEGPILLADEIGGGLELNGPDQGGFACHQAGGNVTCYRPAVTLAPGERLSLQMAFRVPGGIDTDQVRNCVTVTWPGAGGRPQVLAVQIELAARGFDPGVPDGIMGPNTATAIAQAEGAAGLPQTGEISDDLLVLLFGPNGTRAGDANGRNSRHCAWTEVDVPPAPVHYAQISAFHRHFTSAAHDTRTSGPIEVHDPAISGFHLKYKSSMHDGVTTKPVPWHKKSVSQFHQKWKSSQHNPKTTKVWPVHVPIISAFHKTWKSSLHNPVTSLLLPVHKPALSLFHKTKKSALHNPKTTKQFPLHKVTISNFHKTKKSALHNPKTTKQFPIHSPGLSNFHKTIKSALHNPKTTKQFPLHKVTISNFHKTAKSAAHNPKTTKAFPIHNPVLSGFHKKTKSSLHNPATTKLIQLHKVTISNFHKTAKSSQHNPATSKGKIVIQPKPIHLKSLSDFHKKAKSSAHNAATSKAKIVVQPKPVHLKSLSGFHKKAKSSMHNSATSGAKIVIQPKPQPKPVQPQVRPNIRPRPAHRNTLSNFHRKAPSSQHIPATSGRKLVVPQPRPGFRIERN